ncbi:uncharacterized protein LOC124817086 [Hydra vulgaris]|uniref:uncharacterized protein LOC124817086 n=1 Tax=Hydra vulgaris TaxID=6087 RepID=UPI001F5F1A9A|nr:uncharacterized protein LOC124817086 [Hydra vulgaris]
MRRLAHCYTLFLKQEGIKQKHNNSLDMFNRVNIDMLSNVIEVYTKKDDVDIKAGLKQNFKGMDAEAEDVQKFIYTLNWQEYLFGDATYKLNIRSQVNLRKPAKLPREQDLLILRNYILETMKLLCDDYEFHDLHSYVKLRNCACARLTLLCGRRGGEPARMLLTDWNQAYNNEWIDSQRVYKLGKLENFLIKTMKIAYMTGKGNNHLVPVLIPQGTVDAIIKIASNEFREQAGVSPQNKFLFASAQDSDAHISGWQVGKNPNDIIATNNLHCISTLFAALDVPKRDRVLFYSHMGHSEQININFYQGPLALEEITNVGKHLLAIDAGETGSSIYSEPATKVLSEIATFKNILDFLDINDGIISLKYPDFVVMLIRILKKLKGYFVKLNRAKNLDFKKHFLSSALSFNGAFSDVVGLLPSDTCPTPTSIYNSEIVPNQVTVFVSSDLNLQITNDDLSCPVTF